MTSLVFGLLFVAAALMWPLHYFDVLQGGDLSVVAPLLLVGVGVAGVLASVSSASRRAQREAEQSPES